MGQAPYSIITHQLGKLILVIVFWAIDTSTMDDNSFTGLAWDNDDVNMDTIDGKDTLHATVGNMQDTTNRNESDDVPTATGIQSGRKR